MAALLPPWAQRGDAADVVARLRDPDDRARIRRDVRDGIDGWENSLANLGPEAITVANAAPARAADVGRTLADLAAERAADPVDALCDLLVDTGVDATMVHRYASEEAVTTILRHPLHTVGSDGIVGARPHPRLYGSAARFLGRYVLRQGLLPLEEGVARLTARPAELLGLRDRGRIAPGLRADLVLIDPERFVDTADYRTPERTPDGVHGVWVAGRLAWSGREVGERRAGGVVTGAPAEPAP
jgi:N-acyl-D-amino-acid deacylase